jgi:hypothetical protein
LGKKTNLKEGAARITNVFKCHHFGNHDLSKELLVFGYPGGIYTTNGICQRCGWLTSWGHPYKQDQKLFEKLVEKFLSPFGLYTDSVNFYKR